MVNESYTPEALAKYWAESVVHDTAIGLASESASNAASVLLRLLHQQEDIGTNLQLVRLEGDDIVIRITPDALIHATEHGVLCTFIPQTGNFRGAQITDMPRWRDAVLRALRREAENGDTPVHLMLDACLEYALEQGEEGV